MHKICSLLLQGTCTGEPCRQIKNRLSDELLRIEAEHIQGEAAELLRPVAESSLKKLWLKAIWKMVR